eukprot:TRINITY_DN4235_c0_g1_i1.p1 TRINITY_DN4235_c0_g1~~TRINITY_DN4235_c0_g1_i1.p1  ORF type:complete len:240 (+),score=84.14 TRINITY_DN4235_c0_g1_i1:60-779(+)
MSSMQKSKGNDEKSEKIEDDSRDLLNFFSPNFDAKLALERITNDKWPSELPKVKALDNLEKCRALLPPEDPNFIKHKSVKREEESKASASVPLNEYELRIKEIEDRRNRERKEAIEARRKTEVKKETVLKEIIGKLDIGPLGMLHNLLTSKSRVKVLIRRVADVRGFCVGTLLAFDKHFNLVLSDVHEEYYTHQWVPIEEKNEGEKKKYEKVSTKHTKEYRQLFIKGDNVILVYRSPDT